MAGFVECLSNEEGTEDDDGEERVPKHSAVFSCPVVLIATLKSQLPELPDSDPQGDVSRIRHATQVHILNLLITSLELKTPNLALYLLGFEVKKPVSSTTLQDAGQTSTSGISFFDSIISGEVVDGGS